MAEVQISYKGSAIAQMNASGTKTLLTEGKYLEDDVEVTYTRPAAPSGTKNINSNGTHDVTQYASANVQVPNTYAAGDEGKVVSNGALVAQGSDTVTQNDTYDTTLISSLTVNVSGGGGTDIGLPLSSTGIVNILNMFYALKNGTAKTGEFTLATALPNAERLVVSTGLSSLNGFFVCAESESSYISANTPENDYVAMTTFENGTMRWSFHRMTKNLNGTGSSNQNSSATGNFLTRCTYRFDGGDLYVTASMNANNNYTPFHSGITYRWVAW